jgi:hypothetical protein
VSDVLALPLSLLSGGTLADFRQIFHLSGCPNLPGHLSMAWLSIASVKLMSRRLARA